MYGKLHGKIENLLTLKQNSSAQSVEVFETSNDVEILGDLARTLPENISDRSLILFSKIPLFFEAGLLLEENDEGFSTELGFVSGNLVAPSEAIQFPKSLKPATAQTQKVFRLTEGLDSLKRIGIFSNQFDRLSFFWFTVTPEISFLLASQRADPWLRDLIEKTHSMIEKTVSP